MRLRRIGLLTFHRPINYGSYWQARLLAEELDRRGFEIEILDHDSPTSRIAERRLSLQPTLPSRTRREDLPLYKEKIRKYDAAHCGLPRSKSIPLDRLETLDQYDAVVVGSDEVWNLRHPLFGGRIAFFGVGLPARKVVAYGGSFGNYSCWEGIGVPWTELLSRFHAISVRDENSWWMLKHALNRELPLVLDPCLLAKSPLAVTNRSKHLLVYGHNFSDCFIGRVRAYAQDRDLKLLSFGYFNEWADDQWIAAGPEEFPDAVAQATGIVTNFFHGAVFALRHQTPFVAEVSDYRAIKMRGLLEAVGGEAHLDTGENNAAVTRLDQPISPNILTQIEHLRRTSYLFLDEALG